MLGQLVGGVDPEDVEPDERVRAEAVVRAVQGDQVAVGDDPGAFVAEVRTETGDQRAQGVGSVAA